MKKLLIPLIAFALMFILCSCGFVNINSGSSVQLVYKNGDTDIEAILTNNEAEEIIKILNNKALVHDKVGS